MWFVFPQLAGLGHSAMAQRFGIEGLAEARAYLDHPALGHRLREASAAMLSWSGRRSAAEILGTVDALKLASSMTLFDAALEMTGDAQAEPFAAVLEAFYGGERDPLTLGRLRQSNARP